MTAEGSREMGRFSPGGEEESKKTDGFDEMLFDF